MRLRNAAKKSGDPDYRRLRNKALSLVKRDRLGNNRERITQGGARAAWGIVNETRGKTHGALPIPKDCRNASDAAEAYATLLGSKIEDIRGKIDGIRVNGQAMTTDPCLPSLNPKFSFRTVGTREVELATRTLGSKKSMGRDGVPVTVWKSCMSALALPVAHLTNCIIESGVWPEPWKHATVTPVLKPGKPPLEVSIYRPVSILCALSKVVEKVLQDQLSVVAESKILPQEQHGFRPGRNTETALATLLSAADQAKRNNKKAALVTFDFSSAFDTIDSRTLERRMEPWATREAISLLINYLSDCTQDVNRSGTRSLTREVKYGVRQGSILGPLLFTIVTATLPTAVFSENQTLCA